MTEDTFKVRTMTQEDLKLALSWASAEGWNPGLDDVNNFYSADPGGFLIGELNGEPISCISVVRYNSNFNFIGIYIVKPEYRHQGFGFRTWQAAFELIPGQNAALDAVLQQVNTYQKFGFKPFHSHLRYQGMISGTLAQDVVDLKTINLETICDYDRQYFPGERSNFLQQWIHQPDAQGYGILKGDQLVGYSVIRKATDGYKIAPLFAENEEIAEKLFLGLACYANGDSIYMDVPNINAQAISLVERYQMQSMFECVRMYMGDAPNLNWNNIFAVTSLEIG